MHVDFHTDCTKTFHDRGDFAYATGLFLIVGVLCSYIPQHIAIIRKRTSQGISWPTVFLANVSTCSNTINAVLEQWDLIVCCPNFGFFKCQATMLSIYQIAMGWLNSIVFFILVLLFFPKDTPPERKNAENKKKGSIAWWLYVILGIASAVVGFVLLIHFGPSSRVLKAFAQGMGVISTIAIVLQWSPQIVKTFRAKDVGSLSIVMLLLQAPGSFIVVVFQGVLYKEDPTTWAPFLLTGVQQVVLLIMCIYFEVKNRLKKRSLLLNEDSPLLTDTPR